MYDLYSHELKIEDGSTVECKIPSPHRNLLRQIANYETFRVRLPLWRNKVDIYANFEKENGFIATVHLARLGVTKNLERRLRKNSRVMIVKVQQPLEDPTSGPSGSTEQNK